MTKPVENYTKDELLKKRAVAEKILKTNKEIPKEQRQQLLKLIQYIDTKLANYSNETTEQNLMSTKAPVPARSVRSEREAGENVSIRTREKLLELIKVEVKPSLKSPISAVFCTPEELHIFSQNNNVITVNGFVHSQNSYGAMIKSDFSFDYKVENGRFIRIGKSFNMQMTEKEVKHSVGVWTYAIISTILLFFFFYFFDSIIFGW